MKKGKIKINFKILIFSFALVYIVAFMGILLTLPAVNTDWYNSIKPSITPPNLIFPIVWNILFFLIALSLYFSLIYAKNKKLKFKLEIVFAINFLLNTAWTFFYFYLKNPFWAFFDLILLLLSIASMIYVTRKINKKISWLLIPYLLWTLFAGVLNYLSIK